jgi:streptogramin lyase
MSFPQNIAAGPDGTIYFVEAAGKIGRLDAARHFLEFPIPDDQSSPNAIALGADGNLWFTEEMADQIVRMTPAGQFTRYSLPTPGTVPYDLTWGLDGAVWFTEAGTGGIARFPLSGPPPRIPGEIRVDPVDLSKPVVISRPH